MIVISRRILIEDVIDYSIKVVWFELVNTTYVHYKIISILYKNDIYDGWMAIWAICLPKSLPQFM
jgi:hypothetical protein